MNFDSSILFGDDFSIALEPTDLSTGAKATNRASIREAEFLALWFYLKAGGTNENVTVTLTQNLSSSGGASAPLQIKRAQYKVATTSFTNANAATSDKWISAITPDSPVNSWDTTLARVAATNALQVLITIAPASMNLAAGYTWVEAQFTDPGSTAQLGNALWFPIGRSAKGRNRRSVITP